MLAQKEGAAIRQHLPKRSVSIMRFIFQQVPAVFPLSFPALQHPDTSALSTQVRSEDIPPSRPYHQCFVRKF